MRELNLAKEIVKILTASEKRRLRYRGDIAWLDTWIKLWESDRIRVGVIGVTSSGKSTLINALLGDKLLSVAVRPSSSQLVSCSYGKECGATVYFLDGEKRVFRNSPLLDKIVKKYSDERENQNNKERVAQLELSAPNFDLGEDVLLVDSPGLDASGYEIHEKLTLETLLPTVDVVIFVTTVKSEIDSKIKQTLNIIAKYNCPVMIVQNMLDAVCRSADGTRSAAEEAERRLNRVYLAVEKSNIKNKRDVRVSQISAISAMKYRTQKNPDEEVKRAYKKSRYEEFVSGVKELLAAKRPEIEQQRVRTITTHFSELIRQENARTANISMEMPPEEPLMKAADEIEKARSDTYEKIKEVIRELNQLKDKYFPEPKESKGRWGRYTDFSSSFLHAFRNDTFGEREVKEINAAVKKFETALVKCIGEFSDKYRLIAGKLNLPIHDVYSYNGLPNRVSEAQVKTKTVSWERTQNKAGFGNWLLRGLTNRQLGVEIIREHEEVLDDEKTYENAKRYLENVAFQYRASLGKWSTNSDAAVSNIKADIDLRLEAIQEKKEQALDAEDWAAIRKELVNHLGACADIGTVPDQSSKKEDPKQTIRDDTKLIKVPAKMAEMYRASDEYLHAVQSAAFRYALRSREREGAPALVVSSSTDNLASFIYRFYGNKIGEVKKETVYRFSPSLTAVCSPTEEQLREIQESVAGLNVFLLIDGLRFYIEQEVSLRKLVKSTLDHENALFLVVQDFQILANGNAIAECIRSVRMEQKDYPGIVLINHTNPVYNMAIIHAQTNEGKLMEETEFQGALVRKFRPLVNQTVQAHIKEILRTNQQRER